MKNEKENPKNNSKENVNAAKAANADNTVNSDNSASVVNSEDNSTKDNLFADEMPSTVSNASALSTEEEKPQRISKQQRKLDFAEYQERFLTPALLKNRHSINIEEDTFRKLAKVSRQLGDIDTTVSSYIEAILKDHLERYAADHDAWRKL